MDKEKEMLEKKMALLSQQSPKNLEDLISITHAMVEVSAILLRMEEQIRWQSSCGRYKVRNRAAATEQGRKELANAIRDILVSQLEDIHQRQVHRSEQQPCPTEHTPDLDG